MYMYYVYHTLRQGVLAGKQMLGSLGFDIFSSPVRYVMKAPNCPGMGASRDRGVNGVTADGKGETLIDLPHL